MTPNEAAAGEAARNGWSRGISPGPAGLEQSARPLLELMQAITGLKTSFITGIDWDAQEQEVLFTLNTSDLVVAEGSALLGDDGGVVLDRVAEATPLDLGCDGVVTSSECDCEAGRLAEPRQVPIEFHALVRQPR